MDNKNVKRILIIDDEENYQRILKESLSRYNFEIISAEDGEEGLRLALEKHPDLILLDIMMPKMDGLTMLKELRQDDWGKDAKVIMLTILSDNDKVAEAMSENTFDYFVKTDVQIERLTEKIKKELEAK